MTDLDRLEELLSKAGVGLGSEDPKKYMGARLSVYDCRLILNELRQLREIVREAEATALANEDAGRMAVATVMGLMKTLRDADTAIKPFSDCIEQIAAEESDEEWAKFRLLIGDYRRIAALHNKIKEVMG